MKKKILTLCLCIAMLAIAMVGGTMAYFTDTDDAANVFTAGNLKIDLTEAKVDYDSKGNLVQVDGRHDVLDDEKELYDYKKIYPGQTIFKDPTIENLGSEDAYFAAKVTITDGNGDIHTYTNVKGEEAFLLGISKDYDNIDISKMVSGGLADGEFGSSLVLWNGINVHESEDCMLYQVPDKANGTYVLYFFVKEPQKTGDKVVLFDTITIPKEWDNEEMAQLAELKIKVEAFATQTYGFEGDYFKAITASFPEDFPFASAQ